MFLGFTFINVGGQNHRLKKRSGERHKEEKVFLL